jgi:hypothetical protein
MLFALILFSGWLNDPKLGEKWRQVKTRYKAIPPLIGAITSILIAQLYGYPRTSISMTSFLLAFIPFLLVYWSIFRKDWIDNEDMNHTRVLLKYIFIPLISIASVSLIIAILIDVYVTIGSRLIIFQMLWDIQTGIFWGIAIATTVRWFIIPLLRQKL